MPVLLVDDDPAYSFAAKSILEMAGYAVVLAESGNECLKMLADGLRPRMVFLDLVLPDIPGIEVFKKIQERFPSIPVAIVTGYDSDAMPTKDISPKARMDKPVTKADLMEIIDKYGLPETGDPPCSNS